MHVNLGLNLINSLVNFCLKKMNRSNIENMRNRIKLEEYGVDDVNLTIKCLINKFNYVLNVFLRHNQPIFLVLMSHIMMN